MIFKNWFSQIFEILYDVVFKNSKFLLKKIKDFFTPPKSQKEYYTFGRLMISKKLFVLCFFVLSFLSLLYLVAVVPEKMMEHYSNKNSNKIFTKYYNSRSLKNYSGEARIVTQKSDAEYIGEISKGVATGQGCLYDKQGKMLYNGNFVNNQYSGTGTLYYDNGNIRYIGLFSQNNFNGEGKLYDLNSKLSYDGEFVNGLKMGKGILFNSFEAPILEGVFSNDMPLLEKYLGEKMSVLSNVFLEDGITYSFDQSSCVIYKDLGVMASSSISGDTVVGDQVVSKIYILDNKYFGDRPKLEKDELDKKIDELGGTKRYAGYARVMFNEMSAIDYLRKKDEEVASNLSEYSFDSQYADVFESRERKSKDKIYIQSYKIDDVEYAYYFVDKYSQYIFYSIERVS